MSKGVSGPGALLGLFLVLLIGYSFTTVILSDNHDATNVTGTQFEQGYLNHLKEQSLITDIIGVVALILVCVFALKVTHLL